VTHFLFKLLRNFKKLLLMSGQFCAINNELKIHFTNQKCYFSEEQIAPSSPKKLFRVEIPKTAALFLLEKNIFKKLL